MSKNKQAHSIDKYFKKQDLTSLVGSKYTNIPKLEGLWSILEDLWKSIQAANGESRYFNVAIMTLFSMVAEYYTLQLDKNHRSETRDEFATKRIDNLNSANGVLEQKRTMYEEQLVDTPPEEFKTKRKYFDWCRDIKQRILDIELAILDNKSNIKAAEATKGYHNYTVTKNGQIMYDITTQLMTKAGEIIKILKEFNVSPNKVKLLNPIDTGGRTPETLQSHFKKLG